MALTDSAIRAAKPAGKPIRLFDEGGLYLEVAPSGGKWWRLKYRLLGKEKRLSLGVYPEVGLKDARARRDEARKLVAAGTDPSDARKAARLAGADEAANTFEALAREWLTLKAKEWVPSHLEKMTSRLELYAFPAIGKRPIATITASEVLAVSQKLQGRGVISTAHRVQQACGQVFRYAVATARANRDPVSDLRGALPSVRQKHFAAVTDPNALPALLTALHGYAGGPVVRAALKLAPLLFVRPGELRTMEWAHVDLCAAEWRFTTSKTNSAHIVPLATQAVEVLRELQGLTGRGKYVFATARGGSRPMSENGVLMAMRSLGIGSDEMTGHGFRATARTILDEVLGFRVDWIEHQLAHAVKDANGRAYNRTAHLSGRRKMMQAWADYLDGLRNRTAR
ncbi:tyrosine-type recombinase/integrase [Tahibacter harae]|uniref:Integrase arm-type DNA-binding domain-containing protein n=1 Tax=Tahibacter harae TaxID=2963937 RepID=A0ABT1QQB1_9GAMM|nr:integrase arm-type DNA-binding domain-containing protein [Tahibacter harae]MCQ4164455.1 integrase arm-type DNA-binding domain-containing protein [Tahibacter harae]